MTSSAPLAFLSILCTSALLSAQQAPPRAQAAAANPKLDHVRITSGEFGMQRFGPVRWLDGGSYATLERDGEGLALVKYDAVSGEKSVVVGAARCRPPDREKPFLIEDYEFAPDGKSILLFTDSERVWRQNTRGEYFVVPLAPAPGGGEQPPKRLGGALPKSTLMFAKWSPQGDRVGYVSGNDLYVEDVASGKQTRLTKDGSRTIINGTFDWVYEEEFDCRDGFRWSPDGTRIAYWQLDCSGVGE